LLRSNTSFIYYWDSNGKPGGLNHLAPQVRFGNQKSANNDKCNTH